MSKEYLADSAGAGEFRGGCGQRIEIGHAQGAPFVISKMFDRIQHPAHGRRGGGSGAPGKVYLKDGGKEGTTLKGKGRDLIPANTILVMETPGGGGIGDVRNRDPDKIREDVTAGLVTPAAAKSVYGQVSEDP